MAKYALLIYVGDSAHAHDATPADLEECDDHADDLTERGSMVMTYALTPRDMATPIRGNTITDGPFLVAKGGSEYLAFGDSELADPCPEGVTEAAEDPAMCALFGTHAPAPIETVQSFVADGGCSVTHRLSTVRSGARMSYSMA